MQRGTKDLVRAHQQQQLPPAALIGRNRQGSLTGLPSGGGGVSSTFNAPFSRHQNVTGGSTPPDPTDDATALLASLNNPFSTAAAASSAMAAYGVFPRPTPPPPPPPVAASSTTTNSQDAGGSGGTATTGGTGPQAYSSATVPQLKAVIEKQRQDIEVRTDNVNAIQRNFQRLSDLYATDKQRLNDLERENAELHAELKSLRGEKKLMTAVQIEYDRLHQSHADLRKSADEAIAKLTQSESAMRKKSGDLEREVANLQRVADRMGDSARQDSATLSKVVTHVGVLEQMWNGLCQKLTLLQRCARLEPGVLGDGIAAIGSSSVGSSRESDGPTVSTPSSQQLSLISSAVGSNDSSPDLRVQAAAQAIALCAAKAIPPIVVKLQNEDARVADATQKLRQTLAAEAAKAETDLRQRDDKIAELTRQLVAVTQECKSLIRASQEEQARRLSHETGAQSLLSELESVRRGWHEEREGIIAAHRKRTLENERSVLHLVGELEADARDRLQGGIVASLSSVVVGSAAHVLFSWTTDLEKRLSEAVASAVAERANADHRQVQISSLQGQLTTLQHDLKRQRDLHDAAITQGHLERDRQTQLLSSALRTAQDELAAMKQTVVLSATDAEKQLATNRLTIADLERKIEKLQHDLVVKTAEGSKAALQLLERERQITEANESVRSLSSELAACKEELVTNRRAAQRLTELQQQYDMSLRSWDVKRKDMEQTILTLTNEVHRLQSAENHVRGEHTAMAAEMLALQRQCTEAKSQSAMLSEKVTFFSTKAESMAARSKELEATVDSYRRQFEDLQRRTTTQEDGKRLFESKLLGLSAWAQELRVMQEESVRTAKKLLSFEEACEPNYSCEACIQVMKDPVICAPCGHAYCKECLVTANAKKGKRPDGKLTFCPECDASTVSYVLPSRTLDLLTGKFAMRKMALQDMATLLERVAAKASNGPPTSTA